MADLFSPDTSIFFAYTGLDDYNKTVHDSISNFVAWAKTKIQGTVMENCSFQRLNQSWEIRVSSDNISYNELLLADTVVMFNGEWTFWVGLIDKVEWKNPGCFYVYFHVDWYSSTLGYVDYEDTTAFVEREHIKKDWDGANPMFSNMGPAEGFGTRPDTPIYVHNMPYAFRNKKVCVYSPYDDSGQPNFAGTMDKGLYSAMYQSIMTADECNNYLKTISETTVADLQNIVSIVSVPDVWASGDFNQKFTLPMPWIEHVDAVPTLNNGKCWSGEFCQIKLESGTGQAISVNTQWFGNGKDHYNIDVKAFLNNGDGGCIATLINENGTYSDPTIEQPCYGDFSVSLIGLPQSPWVGNAFAQWKASNVTGMLLSSIGSIIGSMGGMFNGMSKESDAAMLGGALQFTGTTMHTLGSVTQSVQNAQTSGTAVGGTISTDTNTAVALNKFGFQAIHYMCQSYIMLSIDSYFDRFGYRVNKLKKLDRKARPKWTFIKTVECHIKASKPIPIEARQYIQGILNTGCTFWMDPEKVGDYSDPAGNKGV